MREQAVKVQSQAGTARLPFAKQALVGIVVVTHNSSAQLYGLLQSLGQSTYQNVSIAVIDSGSSALEVSRLTELQHLFGFELQFLPQNVGFGAATNVGLHYFRALGARYVWLLNPDTLVEPEALGRLVRRAAGMGSRAVLGSKVLWLDSNRSEPGEGLKARIWSFGGTLDVLNQEVSMLGHGDEDTGQYVELRKVDYIPGCALFLPICVLDEVGYFPEEFFLYFEETEWCRRAREMGLDLFVVPNSVVWHDFRAEKLQDPIRIYYYNRNERRFWFRQGSFARNIALVFRTLFRDLPRVQVAIRRVRDKRLAERLKSQRRAYIHFLCGRMGRSD